MKKIILVFYLFLSLPLLGQVNLDSLWGVWNDPNQPDTIRIDAMNKIAWYGYAFSQPDSAFYFAQLNYNFAESKGLKKKMARSLNLQGVSFRNRGDYDSAIHYHNRSLTIKEEIGFKIGIASSLNNIGNCYKDQSSNASAIDYFTRSLIIFEEIGDKRGIAISLNNIGNIYEEQGDHTQAMDYYTRSLSIRREMGSKDGIAYSLNNIGIIFKKQGDYRSAIDYYTRSLILKKEIGDKKGICNSLNNIGNIYLEQGDSASIGGITSLSIDKYTIAIDFSSRALDLAQEINFVKGSQDPAKTLYRVYNAIGKHQQALEMHELYIAISDSIESEQNQKIVIRQEYKYAYEKQKLTDDLTHEAELTKETNQRYALYTLLSIMVLFATYVYRALRIRRSLSKSIELSNSKLQELNATKDRFFAIISHDLRGAITSFSGIGEVINYYLDKNENDKIKDITKNIDQNANQLHNLLDNVLHWSVMEMGETTFKKTEISLNVLIKNMMKLYESSAKSKEISLNTDLMEKISINADENALNVIFRNFISNAIKFTAEQGVVNINAFKTDDDVIISFKDDGIGMEKSKLINLFSAQNISSVLGTKGEQGIGLGLRLCKHFIDKHGGRLDVESEINRGTTFSVIMPLA